MLVKTVSRLSCGQPKLKQGAKKQDPGLKSQNKTESQQEVEEIKQPEGYLGALGSQEPGRQVPVEGATSK